VARRLHLPYWHAGLPAEDNGTEGCHRRGDHFQSDRLLLWYY